jgi:hypothetical protein
VAKHTPAVVQQSRCSDRTTAAIFQRLQGVLWCHAGFQPASEELWKYEGKRRCIGDLKLCSGEQTISSQQCFDGTSGVVLYNTSKLFTRSAQHWCCSKFCFRISVFACRYHSSNAPHHTLTCYWHHTLCLMGHNQSILDKTMFTNVLWEKSSCVKAYTWAPHPTCWTQSIGIVLG